jgi:PhnB protein
MNRAKSIPVGWHSVTPRLVVPDPRLLVDFLKNTFDANGEYEVDRPSLMRIGDSMVMVNGVGPREAMPAFLYVYVDDVDATYRRALRAGGVSIEAPREVPYGDRRAMVKDPCGNDWQIATHKPAATQ